MRDLLGAGSGMLIHGLFLRVVSPPELGDRLIGLITCLIFHEANAFETAEGAQTFDVRRVWRKGDGLEFLAIREG
jgi:hypothetical protein